jgi:hypothetical protein
MEGHYIYGIGRKAGVAMQQKKTINGNEQSDIHQS